MADDRAEVLHVLPAPERRPAVTDEEAAEAGGEYFGYVDAFDGFLSHCLQRPAGDLRLLGCFAAAAAAGPNLASAMRWGTRRANLWALVMGESGVGKTTATEFPHKAIGEVLPDRLLPTTSTPESLVDLLRDLTPDQEQDRRRDGVPCYKGTGAIVKDEISRLFRQVSTPGYMANAAEQLIELYDGGRPVVMSTRGGGVVRVSDPCLSLLGATTYSMFANTVKPELVSGGFLPRFIFLELPRQDRAPAGMAVASLADDWRTLCGDLAALRAVAERGQLSAQWAPDLLRRWDAYRDYLEPELAAESRQEEIEPFYHRFPEHALKLAMILAFSQHVREGARGPLSVSRHALVSALQVVERSRASVRRVLDLLTVSPMVREAYRAQRGLLGQPGHRAGTRELYRAMHWAADDARKARQTAESHGLIDPRETAWVLVEDA